MPIHLVGERKFDLFDESPLHIGGFVFKAQTCAVDDREKPKLTDWQEAFTFALSTEHASPFWVGDLYNYAEGRPDWREKLQQALTGIGRPLDDRTLSNRGSVSKAIGPKARKLAKSFSHAAAVAGLSLEQQCELLEKAQTENLTAHELRREVKAATRPAIIEGQAELEGRYRVLYADPPWSYGNRPPSGKGAGEHYPTMSIEELCALPMKAHCTKNAVLFLWVTAPLMLQEPGPREVGQAWGFEYKSQMVWDKVDGTFGHYTGGNHEVLTIWTRGSCIPDLPTDLPDSVQVIRKTRVHSEKPEEFRKLIEKHYLHGPRLELFGRKKTEGWTVFGNDSRLWATQGAKQTAAHG